MKSPSVAGRAAALALVATLALAGTACGDRQLITRDRAADTTGGTTEETGGTTGATTDISLTSDPRLTTASNRYRDYVVEQVALLERETDKLTSAVEKGDVERAKELYPAARTPWERIEPVAALLGDFDPAIDAREGDVPASEWTGFHPIEQALWEKDATKGQKENARKLREDVSALRGEVEVLEVRPVDLVSGSVELLNEVSIGKITGEEERYSHTDLYDFEANLQGSEKAFELLTPALKERDPELVDEVRTRFDDVYAELDKYRRGDGWVSYDKVTGTERQELSRKLDALAEPLSRVGSVLQS